MKKCLIFDLDGTLIDSREDLMSGVNMMRAHYGLEPLSLETVTRFVGNGARKLAERSLRDTGVETDEALELMKKFYTEKMLDKTFLYTGVKEGLSKLHAAGIPMAVITNKPTEPCKKILKHLEIDEYFAFAIGGGPEFPLKPTPDSLLYVIEQTNAEAGESWILGDNYTDLESGRRAGMKKCFAHYGFGLQGDEKYDASANSFAEFVELALK